MNLTVRTLSLSMLLTVLTACSSMSEKQVIDTKRDSNCKVNENIARNTVPKTPNNMSLPSFGQGIIGWATGPEGAKARLENVSQKDIPAFTEKGVTLEMVQEWQAFYDNEVNRNPCNPTAPYRAKLMKKIAELWVN